MAPHRPLLSIVIPTKNRYEYLVILLKGLLSDPSREFEIIVQDNSDDNAEFVNQLEALQDDRLVYRYVSGWISVVENCDRGLAAARGEFVCMLGDDDGILIVNSIYLLRKLKEFDVAVADAAKPFYSWPDSAHATWNSISGKVLVGRSFSWTIRRLDAVRELQSIVAHGGARGVERLPSVYQAFVRQDVLAALREQCGTCFPGPSPDMANAIAITDHYRTFVVADFPCVITGHSGRSGGGRGAQKAHHGTIESQSHLPRDTAAKWSAEIPRFWSGPTIYAESLRKALEATGRYDDRWFNYQYLYAHCLVHESRYRDEVLSCIRRRSDGNRGLALWLAVFGKVLTILAARTVNLGKNVLRFSGCSSLMVPAEDIVAAQGAVMRACGEFLGAVRER